MDNSSFHNLRIWQDSMDLAVEIYRATADFPKTSGILGKLRIIRNLKSEYETRKRCRRGSLVLTIRPSLRAADAKPLYWTQVYSSSHPHL
jgi:hypothetical protein